MTDDTKQDGTPEGQSASKAMLDFLKKQKCIVCGDDVWWDKSKLPPACNEHPYEMVWMAVESNSVLDGHP